MDWTRWKLASLICILAPYAAWSQSVPGSPPHFETAFITLAKEPNHRDPPVFSSAPGRIDYRMAGIKSLILKAWPVEWYQIAWPEGMPIAFYDVKATLPRGTTPERLQFMLQALLADRLKLQSHWETGDLPVYTVGISSRGLRIRRAVSPPPANSTLVMQQTNNSRHLVRRMPSSTAFTIAELLQVFRKWLDHPMVDRTGLKGYYEFDLRVPCGQSNCPDRSWSNQVFFDALEMQLGLKVQAKTFSTRMLVIAHLERVPTEN